jgi:DNA uptake protein ComE-like DNA-binding protein
LAFQHDDDDDEQEKENVKTDQVQSEVQQLLSSSGGVKLPMESKLNCLMKLNAEIKNVLEREIVDVLNEGTREQLMALHGIGPKRADLIIEEREEGGYTQIADLDRIGLSAKVVSKVMKDNALGQLNY